MMPPPSVGRGPLNFAIACEGGLRLIRTSPGLAAFAIGALALGIGFTTTMFGIVHGATRPLDSGQDGLYGSIWQLRPFAVRIVARGAGDPFDLVSLLRRETARIARI
jgi:hypothetical protein